MKRLTDEEIAKKLLKYFRHCHIEEGAIHIDRRFLRCFPSRKKQAEEFIYNFMIGLVKETEEEKK